MRSRLNNLERNRKGFSLIESLISLSLFLLIVLGGLEFFTHTRKIFFKLKDRQEKNESVMSTLERIRFDLKQAGLGLTSPYMLGLIEPIICENDSININSMDTFLEFDDEILPGQTRILLTDTEDIRKNRKICLVGPQYGEIKTIVSFDHASINLDSPLENTYIPGNSSILLIRTVLIYQDEVKDILRRKVNTAPAQPLLEEIGISEFDYKNDSNLVRVRISLIHKKEKVHEMLFYPKNTALFSQK